MTVELDRGITALRTEFKTEIDAGLIYHLGITNCRRKNNRPSAPWSEHAWPNAVDVMIRNFPGRQALGDRIARWMRSRPDLWSEVFWWIQAHFDHVHGTANPRRNYDNQQVPACAPSLTRQPTDPNKGDDMLGFSIGKIGATPVRGEQAAALQLLLNDRGANPKLTIDGIAGDATRNALITFQRARLVGPPEMGDGEIGAYTYAALMRPLPGTPSKPGTPGKPGKDAVLPKTETVTITRP